MADKLVLVSAALLEEAASHFQWIMDRLVNVYGESEYVDFVHACKRHLGGLRATAAALRALEPVSCAALWIPDVTGMLNRCACCGTFKAEPVHTNHCHLASPLYALGRTE